MTMKTIFALGFFDGVHLGHQALLAACRELAEQTGCQAGVVTFLNHPDAVVHGLAPRLINTAEDRRRLICRYGVDNIQELPFDKNLMQMPWQDFFALLLKKGAAGLVCGSDFRFGYRGEGTADKLAKACADAGIRCRIIDQQVRNGIRISSTHIRALLEQGNMDQAVEFLGHPHLLTGQVVSGKQLGRTLGIPTANLRLPEHCVVPAFGVYACKAFVAGRQYLAVTNVGTRPTVQGQDVTVEPWILDFDGDLYGQELSLEFYTLLRPERKFPSLVDLREEILKNAQQTRKIFEKV
jgi:riboflavin kinase/FMN adenylyltransferase